MASPWRAAGAAAVGSAVEYYDFSVYGYLTVIIAPLFFPGQSPVAGLLSTLAIFGVAFFVRPLGGIFFGRLGDRIGRRKVLLVTVISMGIASGVIGLLPTHAAVGALAPVLLLCSRLGQGFAAGGEVTGAATFVAESAPRGRRGFFGAFNPLGVALGTAGAAAFTGLLSWMLTDDQMSSWGWRIPFLVSLPLTIACVYARLRIEDSPAFAELLSSGHLSKTPMREVFTQHRASVFQVIGIGLAQNIGYFVGIAYLSTYLVNDLGYKPTETLWLTAGVTTFAALLMPLFGALSDRYGRRTLLFCGYGGYAVLIIPVLYLMARHNFALACVAAVVSVLPYAIVQSVGFPLYAELFGTRVRYSGVALSYNFSTVLGAGPAPFIATYLVSATGDPLSPGFFMVGAALIAIVTLLTVRETSRQELRA